jgi:hypothetical protein
MRVRVRVKTKAEQKQKQKQKQRQKQKQKQILRLWRRMTTKKQKQIPFGDDNQKGKSKK